MLLLIYVCESEEIKKKKKMIYRIKMEGTSNVGRKNVLLIDNVVYILYCTNVGDGLCYCYFVISAIEVSVFVCVSTCAAPSFPLCRIICLLCIVYKMFQK